MKTRGTRSSNGFIGLNADRATSLESGILTVNNAFDGTAAWIRPSNWLSMPDMTAGDQRIALLCAVYPSGRTGNALGATAAGTLIVVNSPDNYTVEWGNGLSADTRGGSRGLLVKYDDLPASTTVTGQMLAVNSGASIPAGYRQVLVQIYPTIYPNGEVGGTAFTSVNVGIISANLASTAIQPSPGYAINTQARPKWLSIKGASSTLTSLTIGGGAGGTSACPFLHEFEWIGPTSLTNCSNLFNGSTNLSSVKGTEWCRNAQNFDSAFANCTSLKELPLLNTSSATNMRNMFNSCTSLETVAHFDTSNVTNFAGMFSDCWILKTIPAFSTSNALNMDSMFNNCFKLVQIPEINTSNVKSFNSTFNNTLCLQYVPPLNTQSGLTFNSMFASSSIEKLYPINLSSAKIVANMFVSSNIANAYLYNYHLSTAGPVKDSLGIFGSCYNLNAVRFKYASDLTLGDTVFNSPIREIITDGANISSSYKVVYGTGYLRRMVLKNLSSSFRGNISSASVSATGQCLSPEALNEMYRNLSTVGASGSGARNAYNLLGHWGYGESLTGIATSKGWNVNTIIN